VKPLRSLLFVPGDSERKLAKGDASGADALIIDLEDAVAPENKARARGLTAEYLSARPRGARGPALWVRVNPLDTGLTLQDLAAIVAAGPDGIMAPKVDGPRDVATLSNYLDALEVQSGVEQGSIGILPVATETPQAPFNLGAFGSQRIDRLIGLTWGAEDLSAAIGASTNLDPDGGWALTYRLVRSLTLLAAHAAGVQAIDTLYVDFRDEPGLRESSRRARAEGFTGRVAIHPDQVVPINESFSPSDAEVAHARAVIAAFDAQPGAGTVGLDGKMLDIPHLKQARKTLAAAAACAEPNA